MKRRRRIKETNCCSYFTTMAHVCLSAADDATKSVEMKKTKRRRKKGVTDGNTIRLKKKLH